MKRFYKTPCILFLFVLNTIFSQSAKLIVLGVAQDGGYPHMACEKDCCKKAWGEDSLKRFVTSFALIDSLSKKWWLFEATPDIKFQLQLFSELTQSQYNYLPNGIFITHAHIGHYTGLMQLGREVINSKEIPVYVLPKMKLFLENNGPWSQLVKLNNIVLVQLDTSKIQFLEKNISVRCFTVPHRDEFSETAGFKIKTSSKSFLFIPDIDKWQKWNKNIVDEVKKVDLAFLDGTFSNTNELKNRKIQEVPHPLISETIELFQNENAETKQKLYFIHFNHSNPVLWDLNFQKKIIEQGFNISEQGKLFR